MKNSLDYFQIFERIYLYSCSYTLQTGEIGIEKKQKVYGKGGSNQQ